MADNYGGEGTACTSHAQLSLFKLKKNLDELDYDTIDTTDRNVEDGETTDNKVGPSLQ